MFELDHMLKGKLSQQHQQEMIKQARLARLAKSLRDAEPEHNTRKMAASQRSIFSSAVLMLTRGG